jgi:membrane protein DedA with SNARE-associated domain
LQRQAQRRASRAKTLAATQAILLRQGVVVLALTRLSPLASPFDIAAGMLGMSLRRYIPPIAVGRMLYCILLLGAGVLSATAWGHGASLPQLAAIISVIIIALIVLPSILSRRLIARQTVADPDLIDPSLAEEPVMASR